MEKYVDKTGTDQKPNPMRDVYLEFPLTMMALAEVTAFGAKKHAPRGWQDFDPDYGINYHMGKMGRHTLKLETEGEVNNEDGGLLHRIQAAWNYLAACEQYLRRERAKSCGKEMTLFEMTDEARNRVLETKPVREGQLPKFPPAKAMDTSTLPEAKPRKAWKQEPTPKARDLPAGYTLGQFANDHLGREVAIYYDGKVAILPTDRWYDRGINPNASLLPVGWAWRWEGMWKEWVAVAVDPAA